MILSLITKYSNSESVNHENQLLIEEDIKLAILQKLEDQNTKQKFLSAKVNATFVQKPEIRTPINFIKSLAEVSEGNFYS